MERVCPHCQDTPLNRTLVDRRESAGKCPRCGGVSLRMVSIRRLIDRARTRRLWAKARRTPAHGLVCARCRRRMAAVRFVTEGLTVTLDVCHGCQDVWFDAGELDRLRAAVEGSGFGVTPPDEPWKYVPALLGMPVEVKAPAILAAPWVTWGLVAVFGVVYLATLGDPGAAYERFGLRPAAWDRDGGATLLTSFFLHGSLLHLVANGWALLVFGDNVEDILGKVRFVVLLAAATVLGGLVHVAGDPRAEILCIGASGGISGVIAFYALRFPRSRIGFLTWWILWWHVPAWFALVLWLGLQSVLVTYQVSGRVDVSALAHLGGAFVGLVAWAIWRKRG